MSPFEAYVRYSAIKAHFLQKNYDAVKYQFKIRAKKESFDKRKDKFFFHKLANHHDINGFLVSLFIRNPELWVGDIIQGSAEAESLYLNWKKRTQSLTYTFTEDLKKLNLRSCLKVMDHQHPDALIKMLQGEISIETLVILTDLTGCLDLWEKELKGDVIVDKYALILRKYRTFLKYERKDFSKILKKHLELA